MKTNTLTPEPCRGIDAYWRAANGFKKRPSWPDGVQRTTLFEEESR